MESAFRVLNFREEDKGKKEKGREEIFSLINTVDKIRVKVPILQNN